MAPTPPFSGTNLTATQFLRQEIPSYMKGGGWDSLLTAIGTSEQVAWDNAPSVERQLFLSTASGIWLQRRAAGVGLAPPTDVGMPEADFRNYAIQVSSQQLTTLSILEILKIFYGIEATQANIKAANAPYVLSNGMTLDIILNGIETTSITFQTSDFTDISAAKAEEIISILNREFLLRNIKAVALTHFDSIAGGTYFAIYTSTLGGKGSIQVSGTSTVVLGLSSNKIRLLDQFRASYVLTKGPNNFEVILPATSDVVARNTLTAAYLTTQPITPSPSPSVFYGYGYYGEFYYGYYEPDIWLNTYVYGGVGVFGDSYFGEFIEVPALAGVGPYLYEGVNKGLAITKIKTTTTSILSKNRQYRLVSVTDASSFPEEEGWVVFAYGYDYQTQPVHYLGKIDDTTIVIDPEYTFASDIPIGSYVNILVDNLPVQPTLNEPGDLWLTNSAAGRIAAELTIDEIAAAGYTITKTVAYPSDVGLGNSGNDYRGVQAISDIVACFAGNDVDAEIKKAREVV